MSAASQSYEEMIAERRGVDEITALKWAKERNAKITFLQSGRVHVVDYEERYAIRDTFIGAVLAIVLKEP